ncbi:MAG: pyridoxine 5'-phosphate synthase [Candidatus Omnitrophica bacterium]|nr:pyridoxine 5'-phosphate synthase [Candidatus Omnitrophota bacterium]
MRLGVNVDHVATLRQARLGKEPDPVFAALVCEQAGADSIVAHLREDRRHIQDKDVHRLKVSIKTKFNLEMSVSDDIVKIACRVKPHQATLVPEKRRELTTEGGLDVAGNLDRIKRVVGILRRYDIGVSLFIDPETKQIDAAHKAGVDRIELHTGKYAGARSKKQQAVFLQDIRESAYFGREQGMRVFAGHGLDYINVAGIARIAEIEELNIGYSIVCRAITAGLETAVREMKELITR